MGSPIWIIDSIEVQTKSGFDSCDMGPDRTLTYLGEFLVVNATQCCTNRPKNENVDVSVCVCAVTGTCPEVTHSFMYVLLFPALD